MNQTIYRISESWGDDAHGLPGDYTIDTLPDRLRAAVVADPDADRWTLPALADGDSGAELDDLTVVITRAWKRLDHSIPRVFVRDEDLL